MLLSNAVIANSARQISCRVVGVSDGDTLKCLLANNKQIKVRLQEIDAPEKNQPYGKKSKQLLSQLVYKRNVVLVSSSYDRYQRMLATVYIDGKNINLEMVRQGLAWAYQRYMKDPAYLKAQRIAQANRIGLWAESNPIYPEQWRKQQRQSRKKAKLWRW